MPNKTRLINLIAFLVSFALVFGTGAAYLTSHTTELAPGVTTIPITPTCDLVKYFLPVQSIYTVTIACIRKDLIRIWPLPIHPNWNEDFLNSTKMNTLQFDTSDVISLLALFVSILFGIGNFLYTRKTFIASTYPIVRMGLDVHPCDNARMFHERGVHQFRISLRNLSENIKLTNITTIVEIKNHAKGRRFWKRSWLLFTSDSGDVIEPGLNKHISTENIIEDFLFEKIPGIVQKAGDSQQPGKSVRYIHSSAGYRSLRLKVTAQYTPAIVGAKNCTVKSEYELSLKPQTSDNPPDPLFWEVKKIS